MLSGFHCSEASVVIDHPFYRRSIKVKEVSSLKRGFSQNDKNMKMAVFVRFRCFFRIVMVRTMHLTFSHCHDSGSLPMQKFPPVTHDRARSDTRNETAWKKKMKKYRYVKRPTTHRLLARKPVASARLPFSTRSRRSMIVSAQWRSSMLKKVHYNGKTYPCWTARFYGR